QRQAPVFGHGHLAPSAPLAALASPGRAPVRAARVPTDRRVSSAPGHAPPASLGVLHDEDVAVLATGDKERAALRLDPYLAGLVTQRIKFAGNDVTLVVVGPILANAISGVELVGQVGQGPGLVIVLLDALLALGQVGIRVEVVRRV